jgi:2-polyprenyl-3-methyl-5-hydroxy-6-metoxy-1,4-benzoquinol methylase
MNEPWEQPWPQEELEAVPHCPVCGSGEREVVHAGLVDNVFRVARGTWILHRCLRCGSAYLDPRPTRESIVLAYSSYYTHTLPAPRANYEELPPWRRWRRKLANGYCNWRYGTRDAPSSRFGILLAWLFPALRRRLDLRHRFLRRSQEEARILDVGFGSGAFLEDAKGAGWNAAGVDPDPIAVANARARGLEVRQGGIEAFAGETQSFDAITMSHVIEHVHDPAALLRTAYSLLKPGGLLYLDTPNLDSPGRCVFGANWPGLDPPRHLVIFSRESLERLLADTGFKTICFINRFDVATGIYQWSLRLETGPDAHHEGRTFLGLRRPVFWLRARVSRGRSEFLTLLARRSSPS